MKKRREQAYAQRFSQVLDFIDRHLDEPLSVERLSRVAHFSKFHFHRQFSNYVGITPNRYVQLARLRRASYRLAFNPLERITDIAMEGGFERSESFSRAFKGAFGQSPKTQDRPWRIPVCYLWSPWPCPDSLDSKFVVFDSVVPFSSNLTLNVIAAGCPVGFA